jgi:endonuclease/exonuclease/phosphatase family metal-dependent hydrolase
MSTQELLTTGLGTDNVNYRQAELLMKYLKEDVDFTKDKVIVMGDFNALKNFFFLSMAAYNLFAGELYDGGLDEATYPTNASLEVNSPYPFIHIDHAFTTDPIDSASTSVIPLKGSDHSPILLSF